MLFFLAVALADVPVQPVAARMAALYDEICLKTFPIDTQVDALMAAKGATVLTSDEVKATLRNDPGRGWRLQEGAITMLVFLEQPPFHACSIRAGIGSGQADLTAYRAVVSAFKASHSGFKQEKPMDADVGPIRIHAEHEARDLPGGGGESLMVIDQRVTDPARRARGETGTMLRYVHQFRTPG
jgi:hypothetical protein